MVYEVSGLKKLLRKRFLPVSALLCSSLSFQLYADGLQSYLQMDLAELMDVEVYSASLFPEPLISAPGAVTVVTAQQIHDRGYRHLGEVLADLPGIDVNHYADGIALDVLSVRGVAGNNKLLILQDGIRVSSPTGDPLPIANNFPLYHVKQVEVITGPGSALYGADAFSGVINIITNSTANGEGAEFLAEGGEYGHGYGHFSLRQRLAEGLGLSLGGHIQDSDNPDLGKLYPDGLPFNGRSDYYQPTRSHSFNAKLEWRDWAEMGYSRSFMRNPTSAGAFPSFVDYGADYHSLIQTVYAKLRHEFANGVSAELNIDHSDYEVDPSSEFVNFFTHYQHLGYKYAEGSRTKIEPRLNWSWGKHRMVAGLSYEQIDALPKTANLPSPYDGSTQFHPNTNGSLPIEIFKLNESNWGGVLQLTSHWNDQWATTIGGRYDDHSTYGSSFTPRASVTYVPQRDTSWELSYAESFLAPSPFLRYENYGSFVGDIDGDGIYESWFMHVPNPDLKPEELRAIELSLNHQPTPWLALGASLYHQEVKRIITATETPVVQSGFVPGGEIFLTTHADNIGSLSATGLELTAGYTTRMFNAETQWWGGAAIVDGEVDEFGVTNDLPYTSHLKFKAGATFNWGGKYVFSPRLHWVGPINGGVDTAGIDAPSHLVMHLHGQVRDFLYKGLELQATIHNLFDNRYYEAGDGSSGGGTGMDVVPQDPRWMKIALKLRF